MEEPLLIRPELVLSGGCVVRRRLAPHASSRIAAEDPVAFAERLTAQGARSLAVTDVDGVDMGRPQHLDIARAIAEATGGEVAYRGGLVAAPDVEEAIEAGLSPLVLDTAAFGDAAVLRWAVDLLGARLAVALDLEGDRVRLPFAGASSLTLVDAAGELAYRGVGEFVLCDLGVAGTLAGPNLDAAARLCDAVDGSVVYSGGIGDVGHVRSLARLGRANLRVVMLATALYEGRLDLIDALAAATQPQSGGAP